MPGLGWDDDVLEHVRVFHDTGLSMTGGVLHERPEGILHCLLPVQQPTPPTGVPSGKRRGVYAAIGDAVSVSRAWVKNGGAVSSVARKTPSQFLFRRATIFHLPTKNSSF